MDKKKILIIARAIHPARYPRAFRATELAIELAKQGHEVILYAVLGDYDYTAFQERHHLKIKNIGKMWFATINSDEKGRRNLLDKILGRLLNPIIAYPDFEYLFRIPRILKREKNIDLLISIAAPHPIHWGCALAKTIHKKAFPKVWIADNGDPYTKNKATNQRPFSYFKYVEKWAFKKSDFISIPFKGAIDGYYPELHDKIVIIPQGFRLENIELNIDPYNSIPTFAYAGIFYKGFRDPTLFLNFLTTVNQQFKFIIFTRDDSLILPFIPKLKDKIEVHNYIPRDELLKKLSTMDFLINFENNTQLQSPSKLIDYGLTKRPILSISSAAVPEDNIYKFLRKDYTGQTHIDNIEQYNIINVAKAFIAVSNKKKKEMCL